MFFTEHFCSVLPFISISLNMETDEGPSIERRGHSFMLQSRYLRWWRTSHCQFNQSRGYGRNQRTDHFNVNRDDDSKSLWIYRKRPWGSAIKWSQRTYRIHCNRHQSVPAKADCPLIRSSDLFPIRFPVQNEPKHQQHAAHGTHCEFWSKSRKKGIYRKKRNVIDIDSKYEIDDASCTPTERGDLWWTPLPPKRRKIAFLPPSGLAKCEYLQRSVRKNRCCIEARIEHTFNP